MRAQTSVRGGQVNAEIQEWGAAQERFHSGYAHVKLNSSYTLKQAFEKIGDYLSRLKLR